jgi:hypothetical protein
VVYGGNYTLYARDGEVRKIKFSDEVYSSGYTTAGVRLDETENSEDLKGYYVRVKNGEKSEDGYELYSVYLITFKDGEKIKLISNARDVRFVGDKILYYDENDVLRGATVDLEKNEITDSRKYDNHDLVRTFEALGETCEDGVRVYESCSRCEYSTNYKRRDHIFEDETIQFDSAGACGGCLELFRCVSGDQRVNHGTDVSVEKCLQGEESQADPMVGDPSLRIIVGSDSFASVTRTNLASSLGCDLLRLFSLFYVVQFCTEHSHCLFSVLKLTALLLALYNNARGFMRQSNS